MENFEYLRRYNELEIEVVNVSDDDTYEDEEFTDDETVIFLPVQVNEISSTTDDYGIQLPTSAIHSTTNYRQQHRQHYRLENY